jgi:hypothetical membrane protein
MFIARHPIAPFALAGVLQPIWFLGFAFVLGLGRQGYDPLRDALSELGELGATTALIWNVAGFGVAALLYAVYAGAIRSGFGTGLLFALTLLQSVMVAGSAVLSCDPGCPAVPQTPTMLGHIIVGLSYFAITALLPIVAWRTFRRSEHWRALARPSLAVGVVLVMLFLAGPALGPDAVGAWQRITLTVAYAWQITVGLRLYALLRRAPHVSPDPAPSAA